MSSELIFAEERQKKIISLLKIQNKLLVNDLADEFSVTTATIRNDLNSLEKRGLLTRTHGGAIIADRSGTDPTVYEKEEINFKEKSIIADCASNYINDGDVIALDSGTTAIFLAKSLRLKRNLTVITSDFKIASILENFDGISTILAGGIVRKGYSCTTGTITNDFLNNYSVDKAFLSANAITPFGELCTADIEQAAIKKTLIKISLQKILICDSSKFGSQRFVKFGNISDMDKIITDSHVDPTILKYFEDSNNDIEVVS